VESLTPDLTAPQPVLCRIFLGALVLSFISKIYLLVNIHTIFQNETTVLKSNKKGKRFSSCLLCKSIWLY